MAYQKAAKKKQKMKKRPGQMGTKKFGVRYGALKKSRGVTA